jgi:hypothetical protein
MDHNQDPLLAVHHDDLTQHNETRRHILFSISLVAWEDNGRLYQKIQDRHSLIKRDQAAET